MNLSSIITPRPSINGKVARDTISALNDSDMVTAIQHMLQVLGEEYRTASGIHREDDMPPTFWCDIKAFTKTNPWSGPDSKHRGILVHPDRAAIEQLFFDVFSDYIEYETHKQIADDLLSKINLTSQE